MVRKIVGLGDIGGSVLEGLKLELCTILCDAGEMSVRAAPNYGTELLLHTLPDIYPFISFSKILDSCNISHSFNL